jgi:hypothetical protein
MECNGIRENAINAPPFPCSATLHTATNYKTPLKTKLSLWQRKGVFLCAKMLFLVVMKNKTKIAYAKEDTRIAQ